MTVKKFFFQFEFYQTLKFPHPFFIFENEFFMIYNVPLFSFKPEFCNKFIVSILLIKLRIKRQCLK